MMRLLTGRVLNLQVSCPVIHNQAGNSRGWPCISRVKRASLSRRDENTMPSEIE
jgi:hypothetical protein